MKALRMELQDTQEDSTADQVHFGPVLGRTTAPYEVDLDRLVWDTEYREEFREMAKEPNIRLKQSDIDV